MVDFDESGTIDFSEFMVATYCNKLKKKQILKDFKILDKDGDGSLTKEDL